MAQCQLISDVDDEGYILKEVAIICIKDRGTRHLKQGVCFEGLAIPNRACHKYNSGAKQKRSLHVYDRVGKKALAVARHAIVITSWLVLDSRELGKWRVICFK